MTDPDSPPTTTRRSFLEQGTLAVGGVGFLAQDDGTDTGTETGDGTRPGGARATQRMIIPSVDAFEGNYVGQFVFVQTLRERAPDGLPTRGCGFDETWPPEETREYNAQLLDRAQEEPVYAEIPVYTSSQVDRISDHTHFVVQNVVECPDGYVGLETEWLTRRALVAKEPGPTVEPTETTDGPGFGVLAAVLGGLGAAGYRALRNRDDDGT